MKSSVLAAIIFVGAAGGAWAADISPSRPVKAPVSAPAQYNWTGFYIGGNVGYGWARFTVEDGGFGHPLDLNGVTAGGLVGFNWQSGMFVGGIEADYQWSDQKKSLTDGVEGFHRSDFVVSATVRGRAGDPPSTMSTSMTRRLRPFRVQSGAFGGWRHHFGERSVHGWSAASTSQSSVT